MLSQLGRYPRKHTKLAMQADNDISLCGDCDPITSIDVKVLTNQCEGLMLKRILYRSHIADHVGGTERREISSHAKAANSIVGIQGALIAINRYFYQVLEGHEAVLTPLLRKIQADQRHYEFVVLQDTAIETSKFDGWDMTLIMSPSPDLETCIAQINEAFDNQETSATVQARLCEGLVYIILGAVDAKAVSF